MYKYLFVFLILGIAACSPQYKKLQNNTYDSVTVMANGGITGSGKGYVIQKTGELYVQFHYPNRPYNQQFFRQADRDSVLRIFNQLEQSKIMNQEHIIPGNMSYSIQIQRGELSNTIVWSDGQDSIQTYIEMYRLLRGFAEGKKE